jgi:hypothetical protein
VGARSPFHGSIDRVVSKEAAEKWIEELLKEKWSNPTNVTYTIAQLARKTDDRTRDINDDLRSRVIERLSQYDWSDHFIKQIQEVLALEWEDEKEIFGESLPVGLYIEN